jgi:peptide deformylase
MTLILKKDPDPVLRQDNKKIKDFSDKDLHELIDEMFETMQKENGVGLAAPQIGKNLKLCVIEEAGIRYILINPRITKYSKEIVSIEEGCLSVPGKFFPIKRPAEVNVCYYDRDGNRAKLRASGMLARACQHEIDHLNGILIIDKISKKK